MSYKYEIIQYDDGFPIKLQIHSIDGLKTHWHNEIEIILVLKGSIDIRIGDREYRLNEDDLILTNYNELHSTNRTEEDNILLVLQIDPRLYVYDAFYPELSKIRFKCKSFLCDNKGTGIFDDIRRYLAEMAWEFIKKKEGHELRINSLVSSLIAYLMVHCDYTLLEDGKEDLMEEDMVVVKDLINYIDENLHRKITLKEIAEVGHVNYYYLSHFIKDKLGISFQEYVNSVRLDRAVKLLLGTHKTMIDIAKECGFASANAFHRLFRAKYDCSPTEYRKEYMNRASAGDILITDKGDRRSRSYLDFDRDAALKKLFEYLDTTEDSSEEIAATKSITGSITIDARTSGGEFEHYWKRLIGSSRAAEGLREGWRGQLRETQRDIGFEYIRFHGIFNDEMMVYNIGPDGEIEFNWSYVDELFDFFLEVGIRPFLELGFMPSEMSSSDLTLFWWKANISPPREMGLWTDLVRSLIFHCIDRYGIEEVESWYFEVWNEPELENVFWAGSQEDYFNLYEATVLAIKDISSTLRVGGPAVSYQAGAANTWLEDFFSYCRKNSVPLDFVTIHIYPEIYMMNDDVINILETGDADEKTAAWFNMKKLYADEDNTYRTINSLLEKIDENLDFKPEVHITEWNASAYGRNLIHDTAFIATFLVYNILKCQGYVDSLGYWTFTDIMEEVKAGISHFHGGFGLINRDGLKKPSYYAYYLLSKLGDTVIAKDDYYIVTKRGEDIQILIYNFVYFDELFASGDVSALSETERYLVFEEKNHLDIDIEVKEIRGRFRTTRYSLNRESGSVFDEWVKMGAPENMGEEELGFLQGRSFPDLYTQYIEIEGEYRTRAKVPIHGMEFIELKRIYSKK